MLLVEIKTLREQRGVRKKRGRKKKERERRDEVQACTETPWTRARNPQCALFLVGQRVDIIYKFFAVANAVPGSGTGGENPISSYFEPRGHCNLLSGLRKIQWLYGELTNLKHSHEDKPSRPIPSNKRNEAIEGQEKEGEDANNSTLKKRAKMKTIIRLSASLTELQSIHGVDILCYWRSKPSYLRVRAGTCWLRVEEGIRHERAVGKTKRSCLCWPGLVWLWEGEFLMHLRISGSSESRFSRRIKMMKHRVSFHNKNRKKIEKPNENDFFVTSREISNRKRTRVNNNNKKTSR